MINLITLLRVILLAPLVWLLVTAGKSWAVEGIFIAAGISDWADGWLARRLGQTSKFGAMLDQICDKIFITGTLVAMVAAGMFGKAMIRVAPVFLIIAREFAVSGWREYAAQMGRAVPVDKLGKIKTITQFVAIACWLCPPIADDPDPQWLQSVQMYIVLIALFGLWLAAILGIISAVNYFRAGAQKVPVKSSAE